MSTSTDHKKRGPKPNPLTRGKLVDAGRRMLHDGGYAATGLKEIVDAARVPKGSFYNHFASKEAFAAEVVDNYFQGTSETLEANLTDPDVPPVTRLRTYFEDFVRYYGDLGFTRGCLMGNLSLEVADHSELIRERLAANFDTWSDIFARCIADAQTDGSIKSTQPAPVLADFVLNAWEGAVLRMRTQGTDEALRTFITVVFDVVLQAREPGEGR